MEKFVGKGYLLDVSYYKTKEKNDKGEVLLGKDGKPVLVEKIKYCFLVGDQNEPNGFMTAPHVEVQVCDADAPILEEVGFMLPINVAVVIRSQLVQVNGRWQEQPKPVYTIVGNVD